MRYKCVKKVAPQANSVASLVKRQACAKVLLNILAKGKTFLSIDETEIGTTQYLRRKWRVHGESNSLPTKDVSPRISLLAAIDSNGGIYFAMVQANVDHEVMGVFLTKLVGKLSAEDVNWRTKTVIVQDNAPYKKEFGVLEQLKRQGCTSVFLGPYSFSAAPCELLFAALKRGNLNPENLPCGKR